MAGWREGDVLEGAYAVTPYCLAIACWLSTLILVKVTALFLECLALSCS